MSLPRPEVAVWLLMLSLASGCVSLPTESVAREGGSEDHSTLEGIVASHVALANPVIAYEGSEQAGNGFTRHWFTVINRASYDDALFSPAPHLPPCGLNTNASRTWVHIFRVGGQRIYGYCALRAAEHLARLWFALPDGVRPDVYITLTDRENGSTVRSNTLRFGPCRLSDGSPCRSVPPVP